MKALHLVLAVLAERLHGLLDILINTAHNDLAALFSHAFRYLEANTARSSSD
jgi:hypothetical protein